MKPQLSQYDKLFGIKPTQWKPLKPKKVEPEGKPVNPHRERQLDAIERERRNFRRYTDLQTWKREKLAKEIPAVARYLKLLTRLAPDAQSLGPRDLDVDLADVIQRLKLCELLPDIRDRWLLVEVTSEWLDAVEKRIGVYKLDDDVLFPDPDVVAARLVGTVKKELLIQ